MRGLLTAIATEGFRRHAAALQEALDATPQGPGQLRAVGAAYVRFAQENPALFRLMFSPSLCDHADPALSEASGSSYGVLRRIAQDLDWSAPGIDTATREDRAQRTEWMLWSLVHGYATLMNESQLHLDAKGQPVHDILQIMPDFDYRRDAR